MDAPDEPVRLPITDELDLHTFRPADLGELLPAYFAECVEQGIHRVRVIHGKGTGTLRQTVHVMLPRIPIVVGFEPAGENAGGWGATIVFLKS